MTDCLLVIKHSLHNLPETQQSSNIFKQKGAHFLVYHLSNLKQNARDWLHFTASIHPPTHPLPRIHTPHPPVTFTSISLHLNISVEFPSLYLSSTSIITFKHNTFDLTWFFYTLMFTIFSPLDTTWFCTSVFFVYLKNLSDGSGLCLVVFLYLASCLKLFYFLFFLYLPLYLAPFFMSFLFLYLPVFALSSLIISFS